jgi:hypothetical protein
MGIKSVDEKCGLMQHVHDAAITNVIRRRRTKNN